MGESLERVKKKKKANETNSPSREKGASRWVSKGKSRKCHDGERDKKKKSRGKKTVSIQRDEE